MANHRAWLCFVGDRVRPESITAGQLGELLKRFEAALIERAEARGLDRTAVRISMSDVASKSADYQFDAMNTAVLEEPLNELAAMAKRGLVDDDEPKTYELFAHLSNMQRQHNAEVSFRRGDDLESSEILATLPLTFEPERIIETVRDTTTFYGRIVRIGGKLDGEISVHLDVVGRREPVVAKISEALALELAPRFHEVVGLAGVAIWNPDFTRLREFHAKEVTPYRETTLQGAMGSLDRALGGAWLDVADVPGEIRRLRGEGD